MDKYHLPYLGNNEVVEHVTKCTTCKKPTEHEYIKVQPNVDEIVNIDPMHVLSLTKRLSICTECGLLKITN
jgi:hypothetical protein